MAAWRLRRSVSVMLPATATDDEGLTGNSHPFQRGISPGASRSVTGSAAPVARPNSLWYHRRDVSLGHPFAVLLGEESVSFNWLYATKRA